LSSKKDKLLESAQKFILKGQLDRAVKDYRQIVALDPGDVRHRQRLAELLVRENCKKEAIAEFEQVGKHFSANDYYLKAIAVYKQIQKLDPGNLDISLILASLNHKQGMTGNALNEYAGVVAAYERSGEYTAALKTVERMLEIDPGNLATLMKKGEVLFRSGARDEAFQVFSELLLNLQHNDDPTALAKLTARVSELYPGREFHPAGHLQVSAEFTTDDLEQAAQERPSDDTGQPGVFDFFEAELPSDGTGTATAITADITETAEMVSSPATPEKSVAPEGWEEDIEIELSDDDDHQPLLAPDKNEGTAPSPASDVEPTASAELDFPADDRLEFEFSFESDAFAVTDDADACPLPAPDAPTAAAAMTEEPLAEDFFDQLDALLADGAEPEPASAEIDDSAFADIFTALKKGAAEPLDKHDLESRYDLGIAYKEMGLYDEAINEFKAAAQGPRRIDCITLQAICFREKGLPEMAEKLLKFGIAMDGVSAVDMLNLKYELAFLCETMGRMEEALHYYGEVYETNPEFHNVAQKIASLKGVDEDHDIIELEMDDLSEF
jgi:tetratricopeptide (TPR) repeat protein